MSDASAAVPHATSLNAVLRRDGNTRHFAAQNLSSFFSIFLLTEQCGGSAPNFRRERYWE